MKRTGIVLTLTLILVAMALHANATPQLRLGSVNALQGQTATINLSLSGGEEPYAGINAKILLPEGVTFAGVSKGALLPVGFTTDWHSVSNGVDNWATVIAYSGSDTFTSSSGTLLEIELHIASDAPLGSHAVQFSSFSSGISNEDGSVSVTHTTSDGTINCVDPEGDSDDDGLSGAEELSLGTDPFDPDTDDDNHSDGYEYHAGTDPNDSTDYPLAVVIFVNDEGGDDVNDGLDFRYAKKTIQAGIDVAVDGQVVVVRNGIYATTGNKNLNFSGKAIAVRSQNGAENAIIDCENNGRGFYFYGSETSSSVVDGFTIINGNTDRGGGIYCNSSSPTIVNCTITDNTASSLGGGIECSNYSSPTITNCIFSNNSAVYGGGMCNDQTSSPTITNCTFNNNSATQGGGMSNYSGSSPMVTGCIFEGNSAESGGGIYCTEVSSPTITACTIRSNTASGHIGGIHCYRGAAPAITNCIITGNSAGGMAGGIGCQDYAEPNITNCTITDNEAVNYGGGITCFGWESWPTVTNSILWGNTPPEACPGGGTVTVTYCDIDQDGYAGSNGNIRQEPLFLDPDNGDFRLDPLSPCVDTGGSIEWLFSDYRGSLRPISDNIASWAKFDIGAFEYSYLWGGTSDAIIKAFEDVTIDEYNTVINNEYNIQWKDSDPFPNNDERVSQAGEYEVRLALVDDKGRRVDLKTVIVALSSGGYSTPITFSSEHVGNWNIRIEFADDPNQFGLSSEQITIRNIPQEYCEGDFDEDGDVDGSDMAEFAIAYLSEDDKADLNGDGFVDSEDLALFAANFGRIDCLGQDCAGDLDEDKDVDGYDLSVFTGYYAAEDSRADLNGDGYVDSNDLALFAANFGRANCP